MWSCGHSGGAYIADHLPLLYPHPFLYSFAVGVHVSIQGLIPVVVPQNYAVPIDIEPAGQFHGAASRCQDG